MHSLKQRIERRATRGISAGCLEAAGSGRGLEAGCLALADIGTRWHGVSLKTGKGGGDFP
ncbi:MAG: hypothetical protein GXO94_04575 [Nitrospirae bacterium]|nr:hypothetical protein [Nitrospirota bacterium]